ncbi:HNH endonuclease signature motif containing protein [Roseicella aquatilis]|uniref:HNH endonuclease n=1 Tax=Roseicella aquatilis TaxID=2527868 RepID=A0A4R4D8L9_9PROT|nr:HNH endonuclease [Roseicella aquatilis]TCZ55430.1 HNH endonuclease [Roseicella aquatilis]
MAAIYASTSRTWFEHIAALEPKPMQVAFWRPSNIGARRINPGDPWFFKEWGAPRVLGYGRFVRFDATTPADLWNEFGTASGAASADGLLNVIRAARKDATNSNTTIGNVVLSEFTSFPMPILLTDVDLADLHVPFAYVPAGNRLLDLAIEAPPPLPLVVPSPASRQELQTEVFARNAGHVAYVRRLYGGRCQITGSPVLGGVAGDLTQVHHIHFLCEGGADHPSNMIALSPDWHAVAHAPGTTFDWRTLEFVVGGCRYGLRLNHHLAPVP